MIEIIIPIWVSQVITLLMIFFTIVSFILVDCHTTGGIVTTFLIIAAIIVAIVWLVGSFVYGLIPPDITHIVNITVVDVR
jgi:hypothetical protein